MKYLILIMVLINIVFIGFVDFKPSNDLSSIKINGRSPAISVERSIGRFPAGNFSK